MTREPVVIVTGASRGLGAATARWLAKAGAAVTLVARCEEKLQQVAADLRRLDGKSLVFSADVSDAKACLKAVETTRHHFGRIDALVNNAGIVQPLAPIADSHPDDWRHNIEVNLFAPFYLVRAAISDLREHNGRVVNVSSGAATRALETVSAYCSGKAALNHFTRVLAAEEKDVTALTVRPGVVDTDMQAVLRDDADNAMPADQIAYYRQLKERRELEPPEIPARAIAWLALYAPREFSGKFLNYDDPRISRPAVEVFGEGLPDHPRLDPVG
jgi:NAD(P)-dependent dehydrogenase (short-subunit alcohol dehydrogenase family)